MVVVAAGNLTTGTDGLGLFVPLFLFCSIFLPLSSRGNLSDIGKAVARSAFCRPFPFTSPSLARLSLSPPLSQTHSNTSSDGGNKMTSFSDIIKCNVYSPASTYVLLFFYPTHPFPISGQSTDRVCENKRVSVDREWRNSEVWRQKVVECGNLLLLPFSILSMGSFIDVQKSQ